MSDELLNMMKIFFLRSAIINKNKKLLEGHMDKNQIDEFIYICLHCHVYDYITNQLFILHTFMYHCPCIDILIWFSFLLDKDTDH